MLNLPSIHPEAANAQTWLRAYSDAKAGRPSAPREGEDAGFYHRGYAEGSKERA